MSNLPEVTQAWGQTWAEVGFAPDCLRTPPQEAERSCGRQHIHETVTTTAAQRTVVKAPRGDTLYESPIPAATNCREPGGLIIP